LTGYRNDLAYKGETMGILDSVTKQFRSVIQWENPSPDVLFYRWSEDGNEIKNASKLIVGPGQGCIFVYEGRIEALIDSEGITDLKTANLPFWTTIAKYMQAFKSEHKTGIYYYKKTDIVDQKWGTASMIKYSDPKYNFEVALKAHGNYSFKIIDPVGFFTNVSGTVDQYRLDQFRQMMGSRIIEPLTDYFAECSFGYSDIDKNRVEISAGIKERLVAEFKKLGFEITDFRIEGTTFDEMTMKRINRIADMAAEAEALKRVGVNYADMQKLEAMKLAAQNEGGAAGVGMSMGAGMGMGQMMADMAKPSQSQASSSDPNDPMIKIKKLKDMLDSGLITQNEFDAKKKDILSAM
jgi:membrane protease subunit (stomatin/prohibitin family)